MTEIVAILGGPLEATKKIFGAGSLTGAGVYGLTKYVYDKTKSKKNKRKFQKKLQKK